MRGSGLLRSLSAVAAGAGLVLWSGHVPTRAVTVAVTAGGAPAPAGVVAGAGNATKAGSRVPVTAAQLACAGLGAKGSPSTVLVASAPRAALPRPALAASALPSHTTQVPSLVAAPLGRSSGVASVSAAGAVAAGRVDGGSVVVAAGALAPGAVAGERVQRAGRARALIGAPCAGVSTSSWLVGGGPQAGRSGQVLLINPGPVPTSVDLAVLGVKGPITSVNGHGIVVAPRSRKVVALASISGSERAPVVHVTASGSGVTAVLTDAWVDGLVPRGADAAVPTAAPSTEQVVAGVSVTGPAAVRVAVPGSDAASVQVRVLTTSGPRGLTSGGLSKVAAGATRDIDISELPAGSYAVQVRSTVPVVAGAVVERRASGTGASSKPSDLAWSGGGEPVTGVAAMALGARGFVPPSASLSLAATGAAAKVTVSTLSTGGSVSSRQVNVLADSVALVDLGSARAVWVTRRSGTVRAAVVSEVSDKAGRLVSISPLADLPLTTTQLGFTQVGD